MGKQPSTKPVIRKKPCKGGEERSRGRKEMRGGERHRERKREAEGGGGEVLPNFTVSR